MKPKIHPKYVECEVTCSCGNTFKTRSTVPRITAQICSQCHPFFTGKQKLVDSAGRVEKFMRRYARSAGWAASGEESAASAPGAADAEAPAAPAPGAEDRPAAEA